MCHDVVQECRHRLKLDYGREGAETATRSSAAYPPVCCTSADRSARTRSSFCRSMKRCRLGCLSSDLLFFGRCYHEVDYCSGIISRVTATPRSLGDSDAVSATVRAARRSESTSGFMIRTPLRSSQVAPSANPDPSKRWRSTVFIYPSSPAHFASSSSFANRSINNSVNTRIFAG